MANDAKITAFWRMFTDRLRERRMTQGHVADELGMSRQAVNAWGRGALPTRETIERLAQIMDWPAADILAAVSASDGAAPVAGDAGHVVRQDLVQRFGVDQATLVQRAVHGLDALRDLLGTNTPRHLSSPELGVRMTKSAQSGSGGGDDIWDSLTPEQRYGLALLIDGMDVDPLDIRAALKVLGLLGASATTHKPVAAPATADSRYSGTRALRPEPAKRHKPRAAR